MADKPSWIDMHKDLFRDPEYEEYEIGGEEEKIDYKFNPPDRDTSPRIEQKPTELEKVVKTAKITAAAAAVTAVIGAGIYGIIWLRPDLGKYLKEKADSAWEYVTK